MRSCPFAAITLIFSSFSPCRANLDHKKSCSTAEKTATPIARLNITTLAVDRVSEERAPHLSTGRRVKDDLTSVSCNNPSPKKRG